MTVTLVTFIWLKQTHPGYQIAAGLASTQADVALGLNPDFPGVSL